VRERERERDREREWVRERELDLVAFQRAAEHKVDRCVGSLEEVPGIARPLLLLLLLLLLLYSRYRS